MNNLFNKIKDIFGQSSNKSQLQEALDKMQNELSSAEKKAEELYGEKFFPEEKFLNPEEIHYNTLEVANNASFEEIQANYSSLKKKYNLEQYKKDEDEYTKYSELNARLDYAYEYFKHKFNID